MILSSRHRHHQICLGCRRLDDDDVCFETRGGGGGVQVVVDR